MKTEYTANKKSIVDTNFDNLQALLATLFQLHRGDLDFGLYRVMGYKSVEIKKFLTEELLPQVHIALGDITQADTTFIENELNKDIEAARELKVVPEKSEKIVATQAKLQKKNENLQQMEADVYSHLYNFFARYYDNGDFMSQRRYKSSGKEAYAIPYNGEEIKLHWANADQYYIKTTENYNSYIFTINDQQQRVCFEIVAADNEQDTIKEQNGNKRYFVLTENFIINIKEKLVIRFAHRPLNEAEKIKHPPKTNHIQTKINLEIEKKIIKKISGAHKKWLTALAILDPTENDETRTVLGKHLNAYTAKNSFDYFIHKDLGQFLRRELDYYLKNEVINIENLALTDDAEAFTRNLTQVKAIRHISHKIIDFIAQLENFQKQLYLKKKFILETQYCITLDKIPSKHYADIAKNKDQHAEWVQLFAIDEITKTTTTIDHATHTIPLPDSGHKRVAYSNPLTEEFLTQNPYLVVDTRHFDQTFTDQLLADLSEHAPIHEQLNGLLIHGENFQALNLLQERYYGQVKSIYIDPPYNTNASAILYKNGYKDSSWMSLINERLILSHSLLVDNGIISVAIDDEEVSVLRALLTENFSAELGIVTVRSNPAGRKTKGRFAPAHEYALFYGKTEKTIPGALKKTEEQISNYPNEDEQGRFTWMGFVRSGTGARRQDRPTLFYPFFVNNNDEFRIPEMKWDAQDCAWMLQEQPLDTEKEIYPMMKVGEKLIEGRWHRGHARVIDDVSEYRIRHIQEKTSIQFKVRMDEDAKPKTWWDKSSYQSANGTKLLKHVLGDNEFDFPKSVDLVKDCIIASINGEKNANIMDYFAGSGTTGHAIININREDNGNRKYILVEMGQHFETVLLPRMKKIIYAPSWRDGKPIDRNGSSQLFQYIRLESYEDTMDSLVVQPREDLVAQFENKTFIEDYQLRYALAEETAQSPTLLGTHFIDPFNYTLSVVREGVRTETTIDLIETFNFLLGLKTISRKTIGEVLTIIGENSTGEKCLILWRDLEKINYQKLDQWFTENRAIITKNIQKIYVNGDHTLNALKTENEHWEVITTEPVFKKLMLPESNE